MEGGAIPMVTGTPPVRPECRNYKQIETKE